MKNIMSSLIFFFICPGGSNRDFVSRLDSFQLIVVKEKSKQLLRLLCFPPACRVSSQEAILRARVFRSLYHRMSKKNKELLVVHCFAV